MVNIGFSWNSLLGIALALSGAGLYFLRSVRPGLARDHDIFFAAVGLLCGGILFFQGWRQDPILQFGQFLLTGSVIFFAVESIRLRGIATEQAKRNVPFVDEERPVSRVYRAELDELESMPDPQPYTRRIRGTDDPREDLDAEYAAPYAAPTRSRRRPPSDTSRRPPTDTSRRPPTDTSRRPANRPPRPEPPSRRPAARPSAPDIDPGEDRENLGDWGASDWDQPPRSSQRPPSRRPQPGSTAPPPRRDRPTDPLANERTGYVYGSAYEDEDPPADESYVDYQPIDPDPQDPAAANPTGAAPSDPRVAQSPSASGWADDADEVDNSADFDDADDLDDDPHDRRFDKNRYDSDRYDSDRYDPDRY